MASDAQSSRICPYYLRSHCREGDSCRRSHDISSWTEDSIPICRFYLAGNCKYKSDCWYSHGAIGWPQKKSTELSENESKDSVSTADDKPTFKITIVPIWKPNEQAFKGRTYADSLEVNLQNGIKGLSDIKLCPLNMIGQCPFVERCRYVHGDKCSICKMKSLHPYNSKLRATHKIECKKELERHLELSCAIQRSQDKICGICLDVVIEKQPVVDRRFGIMEKCMHVFCIDCIRRWRKVKQVDGEGMMQTVINPIVTRSCPQCRVHSDFVIPSLYWVEGETKVKLIMEYKSVLSRKHCKYFKRGQGTCKFGGLCFYLHADLQGNKVVLPPPARQRRYQPETDFDFLAVYSLMVDQDEDEIDWSIVDEIFSSFDPLDPY